MSEKKQIRNDFLARVVDADIMKKLTVLTKVSPCQSPALKYVSVMSFQIVWVSEIIYVLLSPISGIVTNKAIFLQ